MLRSHKDYDNDASTQGYDVYKRDTWSELGKLRQQRDPRRLWFSLPCTKIYGGKERRMLWEAVKSTIDEDSGIQVFLNGLCLVSAGVNLLYNIWRLNYKNAVWHGYNVEIGMRIILFTRSGW